jgi:hypothetical protein
MADNKDIDIAAKKLTSNVTAYAKTTSYYDGNHELQFATEKFKNVFGQLFRAFALNLCPAVCDSVRDKLTLTGFGVEKGGEGNIPNEAWKIWQNNRMGVRGRQIHREAVVNGDAYAIVWVDPMKRTTIYPNRADSCTVVYDDETPGKILWGAKAWFTTPDAKGEKKARLNLFYPDRIERYVSKKKVTTLPAKAGEWDEYTEDGGQARITNPYGVVPIFHFGNNADIGSFGKSELSNAIPIQDALNKSVLDMLVAMEFSAFRQRWATGIEIEYDEEGKPVPPFVSGSERLWTVENPETKFGDFEATDLEQFLKVKDGFRIDVACVTGTPLHYFLLTGAAFPQSGISIEKLESRFINKINDRQESFGQVWEDLMSLALRIEGKGQNIRLFAEWEDPAPLSEKEMLDNLVVKQELGVSDEQLLTEAGYGADDVKKMLDAKEAAAEKAVSRFNAGEELPPATE